MNAALGDFGRPRYFGLYSLKGMSMRLAVLAVLASLGLAGCTYSSSSPPPPAAGTTVVLPPGSTVVCANGAAPPCQ